MVDHRFAGCTLCKLLSKQLGRKYHTGLVILFFHAGARSDVQFQASLYLGVFSGPWLRVFLMIVTIFTITGFMGIVRDRKLQAGIEPWCQDIHSGIKKY